MKRLLMGVFGLALFAGCQPTHMAVPLTDGGAKVILMGSEVPLIIPGRPLDRCKVLSQISIVENDQWYYYWKRDLDNALRNKTADVWGNVAIRINHELAPMDHGWITVSMDGMALHCPEDVLNAAGFNESGFYVIRKGVIQPGAALE